MLCPQVLMGILRLGFVSTYLSQPLLDGFAMGASVTILTSQLRHLLGVRVPRHQGPGMVVSTWLSLLRSAGQANPCDVITSAVCLAVLLATKELADRCRHRLKVPLPTELLVVVGATLVSHIGRLHERFGSSVAGDIPTGFMAPQAPDPRLMWRVALDAMPLALVGSAFSISLAEMFARSHGYSVRANQELLAVGCCNVLPTFFHCFATSAALAKSLVKTAAGCRTQLSSVVSAAVVLLVLLVLAPLFRDLPRSVLACVVVVSLRGALRKVRDIPQLWRLSPAEALVWVALQPPVYWSALRRGCWLAWSSHCSAWPAAHNAHMLPCWPASGTQASMRTLRSLRAWSSSLECGCSASGGHCTTPTKTFSCSRSIASQAWTWGVQPPGPGAGAQRQEPARQTLWKTRPQAPGVALLCWCPRWPASTQ